jgi:predicted metalloprotease
MMKLGAGGVVVLLVLSLLTGRNLFDDGGGSLTSGASGGTFTAADSAAEEETVEFVSFVLDNAQSTWSRVFAQSGQQYREARLVLFRDAVQSQCGVGQSGMGPFYCPLDETVYLDLAFFDELARRFGAPGDFAQAYVIAHEIGHHVQHQLGIADRVRAAQRNDPRQANALSVEMELQADCFAGIWGNSIEQSDRLQRGDLEEALSAASAIGDDRIQAETDGRVRPESFTHGTAAQRSAAFRRGMETGDPGSCGGS